MKLDPKFEQRLKEFDAEMDRPRLMGPNVAYQVQDFAQRAAPGGELFAAIQGVYNRGWWQGFASGVFAGVVGAVLVAVF